MAQIKVNGKIESLEEGLTLEKFLSGQKLPANFVVELNGKIVGKNDYAIVVLNDGDVVELAVFCAGG